MAVNIWKAEIPENRSEREAIVDICKVLQELEDWYGIFVNFSIPKGGKIDALVTNNKGIYILEFKEIFGTLDASLNGKWFVRERPKTRLFLNKGDKNPYNQVRAYYYSFAKYLHDSQRKYLIPYYKKKFNIRAAIIILGELNTDSYIEKDKNIDVLEFSQSLEWIYKQGKRESGLTFEEASRLAEVLHLEPEKDIKKILTSAKKIFNVEKLIKNLAREYKENEPFVMPEIRLFSERETVIKELTELNKMQRSVIIGEGGYGKTFLSQQFALHKLQSGELALIIHLAFYSAQKGIISLIAETIQEHGLVTSEDDVNYIFDDGKITIIFDGLNEVRKEDRAACIQEIKRINSIYSINQIIINCRPSFYRNDFKDFSILEILPWSTDQIDEYLNLSIGSKDLLKDFKESSKSNKIDKALLSTPILSRLICDEFRSKKQLPQNLRDLLDVTIKRWILDIITDVTSEKIALDLPNIFSEIAFSFKRNYQLAADITYIRQKVFDWFSERGGKSNLGYSNSDLWSIISNSCFLRNHFGNITFIHEIILDYFASLKIERMIDSKKDDLHNIIQDPWWSDCFKYILFKVEPQIIQNILKIALNNGNDELLGLALSREVGSNANCLAKTMINELINSKDPKNTEQAIRIIKFNLNDPWSIRILLEVMSREQEKLIPEGKDESELCLIGGWYSGPEAQAGQALQSLVYAYKSKTLCSDAIDIISNIDGLLPSARTAATNLLKGAVGILPDSILLALIRERSKDPAYSVRLYTVWVIEKFLCYLMDNILIGKKKEKENIYQKTVAVLKELSQEKNIGINQSAFETLVQVGEYDISNWSEDQSERIYKEICGSKNIKLIYSVLINRFDHIIGDAHFKAVDKLTRIEFRSLVRLLIDDIIMNRIKIDEAAKKLENSFDPNERIIILDSFPQLNWISFAWVIDDLGNVANNEDIFRFVSLIENPPKIWDRNLIGASIYISWAAARALARMGTKKARKALYALQVKQHPVTSIISSLALEVGENEGKWINDHKVVKRCIDSTKNYQNHKFLSLLRKLNTSSGIDDNIIENFCIKYGIEKIRQMARLSIIEETEIALIFLKKYGKREDIFLVRDVLNDSKKSEFHVLAKETLKILSKI